MFPRQVFGLTGSTYLPDFPGSHPVSNSAFVPDYRCGAAPDSHRNSLFTFRHRKDLGVPTISRDNAVRNTIPCGYLAD
jgi:hypothetical protein